MMERFQARMFNRKASNPKNRPDHILEVLNLLFVEQERSIFQVGDELRQNSGLVKTCGFHLEAVASPKTPQALACGSSESGQTIADIGAGGGYFSLRFARAVGENGRVYAVDTNPKFLRFIEEQARENGCANVETILAAEGEHGLPDRSLDLVFMRNVCHHIEHRPSYFVELRKKLNPTGKIAIVEYKPGGRISFHKMFGHYVPEEVVVKEMESSGYRLCETYSFLPEESFTVYSLE